MIKFDILNRWSGEVQFTAEIDCSKETPTDLKIGLSVQWGVKSDADLYGADLYGANLYGANLRGANLSVANLSVANLRDANLRRSNLRDANLPDANLRDANLRGANLRDANLWGADLWGANLRDANLRGANLSGANLLGANLRDANLRDVNLCGVNLRGVNLCGVNLRGANLSGANLLGAPFKIENIHQSVYEAASKEGGLDMSSWHCGTAHCWAGWIVTLAGEAGKALELVMGTPTAATMILLASDPTLEKVPDFYYGNEAALADMKRLAELEATQ